MRRLPDSPAERFSLGGNYTLIIVKEYGMEVAALFHKREFLWAGNLDTLKLTVAALERMRGMH